ncbi:MAG: hypothetical protein CAF45_006670 [Nitrospira sp. CG24E]|nr:MAG: hypothetical protein CAF45_006670 [Nitrospira sp. CG24E]
MDTSLVLAEDFEWLISCLDHTSKKEIQEAIGQLMQRLFNRSDPRQIELIYETSNRYPAVADIFTWVWRPITLDSDEAKRLRTQHKEIEKWKQKRERPVLTPSPAERVAAALKECELRNLTGWWSLIRELSLVPTSTHYDSPFEWDLMKLPGWMSANEATRSRIISVAERFILCQPPDSSDWLGTGRFTLSVLAGYTALALLLKMKPAVLLALTSDQIEKWCPITLAFPSSGDDSSRTVKDELLKLAYRKSPLAVLAAVKVLMEKELEKGEPIGTATELNGIWDDEITKLLLGYAKASATKPKSIVSLLSILFSHDNLEAQSFASSPLCQHEWDTLPLFN